MTVVRDSLFAGTFQSIVTGHRTLLVKKQSLANFINYHSVSSDSFGEKI